jgi:hypothetical protein
MPIRRYTAEELREILMELRGAKAATIFAKTEPKMRKTDNPYIGRVLKHSQVNGMVNWHYENSVNNQREREGHGEIFEALPRKWGTRIKRPDGTLTPLVEHKGQWYLEVKVQQTIRHEYRFVGTERKLNRISMEELRKFLTERTGEGARQELEKVVILRDYALENIYQLTLDGQEYNR